MSPLVTTTRRSVGAEPGVGPRRCTGVDREERRRRRDGGSLRRDEPRAFAEVIPGVVPAAGARRAAGRLAVAQGVAAVVDAADHRAGALATRPGSQRPRRRAAPLPTRVELVQQRAVEREAAVKRPAGGQNRAARVRPRRPIYVASATQHASLLQQPLVIGVVEPVYGPKQTPRLPPAVRRVTISGGLVRAAAGAAAAAPGRPVGLRHVAFTVYVAAVYVRDRGAAAFVCPAGWTWVEELLLLLVLSGLNRVRTGRRRDVVEAVGGRGDKVRTRSRFEGAASFPSWSYLNRKEEPLVKRMGLGLALGSSKSRKKAWYSTQIFQNTLQQSRLAMANSSVSWWALCWKTAEAAA
ncbi:hypothetical protein EYF80_033331 [Liparis tanakae]|uniref:Uncharacterized protein n=1 Tax=Liparis tanakae TaxID=230148 RepID=A0A4Z2GT35_9TELE|nr:hypothetical protein EYF80_033331 [Liparis tanakae]